MESLDAILTVYNAIAALVAIVVVIQYIRSRLSAQAVAGCFFLLAVLAALRGLLGRAALHAGIALVYVVLARRDRRRI